MITLTHKDGKQIIYFYESMIVAVFDNKSHTAYYAKPREQIIKEAIEDADTYDYTITATGDDKQLLERLQQP